MMTFLLWARVHFGLRFGLLALLFLFGACAQIALPPPDATLNERVKADLAAVKTDVDAFLAAGTLQPTDPIVVCVQGLEQSQAVFEPVVAGVLSAALVAYVRAQQIQAPNNCDALLGYATRNAVRKGVGVRMLLGPVPLPF